MDLLLICENHHIFRAGFTIEGTITNAQLSGNATSCPFCRALTKWPDLIDGILKEITESDDPEAVIQDIKDDLKSIRKGEQSLKRLQKWLPNSPKKIAEYATIVAALVTAYQLVKPAPKTQININQFINEYNTIINVDSRNK